jgi:hypothetical protein
MDGVAEAIQSHRSGPPSSSEGMGAPHATVDPARRRILSVDAFEIEIIEERGILRFALRGPATHTHLLRAVSAIVGETKSRCIWYVLCDTSGLTTEGGAFERFEAAVEFARAADPRVKMAVVARAEIVDYIFQNVARSRGASVAVFSKEVAALQWLRVAQIG